MVYKDDPRWIAAQKAYLAPPEPDETREDTHKRRLTAARTMLIIERKAGEPDAELRYSAKMVVAEDPPLTARQDAVLRRAAREHPR